MPANVNPIFTLTPNLGSVLITAANTSSQGGGTIGTDIFKILTVDASNAGFCDYVRFIPTASVANTATTATVARVFISSQSSGATTSSNTWLYDEINLPAVTAASSTAAVYPLVMYINYGLVIGQSLLVTCHAAPAANTAWRATGFAGNY